MWKGKLITKPSNNKPSHITSLLLTRALKVGQPHKVPKHAQQVEEGLEGRSTSRGSETCSTSCKVWTKVLCKENLSRKQTSLSPFQPLKSFLCHWTEMRRFRPTSTRSRNLFLGTSAKRKSHKHITKRHARDIRVQHLLSFSSSRQEELFYSSSYCRLKIPLLPRSVMTFSSTVLPLSTFSSSTTLPPSHKNIFLYSLVIPQQSFSRLYCPLPTISYSSPPPKNLFSLIPSSCASSSLASFTALLEARWMCGHAALSVPNPRASCLAVRCTRFLGIFAAEYSTYASFPIQYSVSVDFQFTTMFRATWQRYKSV